MSDIFLQKRLCQLSGYRVEIQLNQNRSTMLRVLERKRRWVRLSIHEIFLHASEPVLESVSHYIKGSRKDKRHHALVLRTFIQEQIARTNLTHLVDQKALVHMGEVYDLKKMYTQINEKYFQSELDLSISWYGREVKRPRSRITFGQYVGGLRLIKIHRMLDDPFFPEYFVSFVVYHEMLHAIIPGQVDGRGRYSVHCPAFKQKEREYEHYAFATQWEKANRKKLF